MLDEPQNNSGYFGEGGKSVTKGIRYKRNTESFKRSSTLASGSSFLTPQLYNFIINVNKAGGHLSLQPGSKYKTNLSGSRFPIFRPVFTYVTGEGRNIQRPHK